MRVLRFLVALEAIGLALFYGFLWAMVWYHNGSMTLRFSDELLGWIERWVEPLVLVLLVAMPVIVVMEEIRERFR